MTICCMETMLIAAEGRGNDAQRQTSQAIYSSITAGEPTPTLHYLGLVDEPEPETDLHTVGIAFDVPEPGDVDDADLRADLRRVLNEVSAAAHRSAESFSIEYRGEAIGWLKGADKEVDAFLADYFGDDPPS
jgi:hypothetical protein